MIRGSSTDAHDARACRPRDAWSEEGGGELVVVVGPPAAPAVVALAATGPVPHRDGVRVTGVDAAPGGCFDADDGIVHRGEELCPTVPVQSVGVGDESQPYRPVGGPPAEPGLVKLVVDRYAEAAEVGEVVDGAARGSELEVEQRNGDAVMEDDVLADPSDLSAFW